MSGEMDIEVGRQEKHAGKYRLHSSIPTVTRLISKDLLNSIDDGT
jgi:hypothetical protein